MNDYYEVRLDMTPFPGSDATDLMAGLLGDAGYESFVPDSTGLTAFVPAPIFSEDALKLAIEEFPYPCTVKPSWKFVEGRDWNAEWERNYFQPIVIGHDCVIHSSFHTDVPQARHDIVIDPKMAFGTGHHATTSLIVERLLDMELGGLRVIDMGTGTGILAILAAMRGAADVTGIEIDEFAYNNAVENIALNSHTEIRLIHGDASALPADGDVDLFIANINRNVITHDMPRYAAALRNGGTMLLSGFYEEDVPVMTEWAAPQGMVPVRYYVRDRWACLVMTKVEKS